MDNFKEETQKLISRNMEYVAQEFENEAQRLLNSGALNSKWHDREILVGVALENIADRFLINKNIEEYENLKSF